MTSQESSSVKEQSPEKGTSRAERALRGRQAASATMRERVRNKRIARGMLIFVIVAAAFVLGFCVRNNVAFVASLGFPVEESVPATQKANSSLKSTYNSISARIDEVETLLSDNSMDDPRLDEATNKMIAALMESTDDPYATYFDPERYETYIKEAAQRSYAGVGVLFSETNGRAYAIDVFGGSVAEAAGVQQGDIVLAIDGDRSHDWSMNEVINALARDDGDQVVITWMRPSTLDAAKGTEFTTALQTHAYDEETNVSAALEDGVGYIRLQQITQNAADLARTAANDLAAEGAQSFVLDLRDNPGGYLTQAVDIASLFISSGVVVQVETETGTTTKTASGETISTAPLVVLVNGYTTSAAEVLTAALKDNQRATVVGTTTRGKGSVQVTRELTFGGGVRYTAAYYLTPLGQAINGVGISPNIEVPDAENATTDTQLRVALDTARSLV